MLVGFTLPCIGRLMGLILCECTLYLSFLTWLAMLPCLICFLVLALDIGNPLDGMGSISATPWLLSLLGAFAWLVLPGLYLCLSCLALPPCWSSFLYLILLFLSDGMILLPSPKCGFVCLFVSFSFGLDARDLLPLLSLPAIRVRRLELCGQNPANGKGNCVRLQGPCTVLSD